MNADVWEGPCPAATLHRDDTGVTTFSYTAEAISKQGPVVATTLPVVPEPVVTPHGALPNFFSNLLPEGRRLSTLKRTVKTSLDDELSLLLAVGTNTIGNVSIVEPGARPDDSIAQIELDGPLDFSTVLSAAGIADPAALPGAQDKASARTIAAPTRLGSTHYILKVSPPEYPGLVENEAACFELLRTYGKALPASQVRVLHDESGRSGLLVTRFDRDNGVRWAVEDGAQLLNIPPSSKYEPPMEDVAAAVLRVVARPQVAALRLAHLVAFAWLTGNGDLHAKNVSVINKGRGFELAPIYDIPSTLPYGDSTLALTVGGVRDNLSPRKFAEFTASLSLSEAATHKVIADVLRATEGAAETIADAAGFDPRRRRDLTRVLAYRRRLWGA